MLLEEYAKQNNDFDIYDDLSEIVDSESAKECKANILYILKETRGMELMDIYEAIRGVAQSYYGGIAFEI